MRITAHFKTLTKAIAEARKYGVAPNYDTLAKKLHGGEPHEMSITTERKIIFERVPHARERRIKLTIDVSGSVTPAHQ